MGARHRELQQRRMSRSEAWWFPGAVPGLCDRVGVLDIRHFRELRCHVLGIGPMGSGCQGEGHFYVEAACGASLGGEGGAVGVGDGADDGQAEPVSRAVPGPLGAELPERLEQVLYRVWRDEYAGVADRDDGTRGGQCG